MSTLLFFGDVVGEPGRKALYRAIPELKAEFGADSIIVNGENAAGGSGITPKIAQEFFAAGVNIITLGDHAWDQADLIPWMGGEPRILRPLNLQENTPGFGSGVIDTPEGRIGVMALQGRTFVRVGASNPFLLAPQEAERLKTELDCKAIFVDFHAETTSEKVALGYHLDGCVSAVIGTHTHVQTADATIHEHGTAYLTDAGMCGPKNSIIGRSCESVIESLVLCMPRRFPVAGWPATINAVAIEIDMQTGKATNITPINRTYHKS